ncbi:MAG: SpoIIE family protein phosphatase [Desulfobacterales bacterium]|nr:SpoIIE family protein phosphatase [Desulfobacterales bacterium]
MVRNPAHVFRYYQDNPLTFRLLVYILLCSSAVTLCATVFQIAVDYRKDVRDIRTRLMEVEISHARTIAVAVWNFNDEQIHNLMGGILALPDFEYMEIVTKTNDYRAGEKTEKMSISHQFELPRIEPEEYLGTILITASLEAVYRRIKERVLIILGSQAVKTFVVSFFILFILRHLVTRHLKAMAEFARLLDFKKPGQKEEERFLKLNRGKNKVEDELDRVTEAINQMIGNLSKAAKEMETQARIQGELDAGAIIQKACTPEILPELKGYELAAGFHPAREMSGDYLDTLIIDNRYAVLVVADVSGKGVSAAMYANITRVLLRDKETLQISPSMLLTALNRSLRKEFHANHFLTMGYMVVDLKNSTLTYASAGHEPFILIRESDGEISYLKPSGYPFSRLHADIFDQRLVQESIDMHPGDLVFAYTDGLTDAENPEGEMFGEHRLVRELKKLRRLPAEDISRALHGRVRAFSGAAAQTDDITMIVLKKQAMDHKAEKRTDNKEEELCHAAGK